MNLKDAKNKVKVDSDFIPGVLRLLLPMTSFINYYDQIAVAIITSVTNPSKQNTFN